MIKNPNDIVEKLTSDYLDVFGDELISVIMYGSAVTHEYVPGFSEISIFILVNQCPLENIHKCIPVYKYWLSRGVGTPLIMSRAQFNASINNYPIDYLHIQSNYRVLLGEDFFSNLDIKREYLRSQCDKELKDLVIQLRIDYLQAKGHRHELSEVLIQTVRKLLPLFKALLVLDDRKIPHGTSELISSVEDLFGLGASVLSDVYFGKRLESDCTSLFSRLIVTIELMADKINHIKGLEMQSAFMQK